MVPDQTPELPDSLVEKLDRCSDEQLQEVVKYAQRQLKRRHAPTREIEPRHEHEEIVSVEDRGGYFFVVVEEDSTPEGPIAYHVSYEPDPDGVDGRYHWRFLGPVTE